MSVIYKDFVRPDKGLVGAFKDIPVANIDDCMDRVAAANAEIIPMGRKKVIGTCFTIKTAEGDNLMLHKAMDMAKPGDVLVIDAGGCRARSIFGALIASYCKTRGIAGIVLDGAIRDAEEISEMDYPVYASAVVPNGPYKNGPGSINVPVCCGGIVVFPGDIVVGDGDGVIFIRPHEAEKVLRAAQAVVKKEKLIEDEIRRNGTYVRPWVDEFIERLGREEHELWHEV